MRYSDGDAERWAVRTARLSGRRRTVIGAAIHSVRAVPRTSWPRWPRRPRGRPLHVHLSEQVAENEGCLAAYGVTPTRLLADEGCSARHDQRVHATHLTDDDIALPRRDRHQRLLLPHHRARPRRRHRPEPAAPRRRAARSLSAPTAMP